MKVCYCGVICALLLMISAIGVDCNLKTDLTYIKMCNKTSPVNMRTMNEVLINKRLDSVSLEGSAFKCFLHCLFTKYGWMDEEGGFLLKHIKRTLEESEIDVDSLEFVLYRCTALESVDKCERSFEFTRCFWEKLEEPKHHPDDQLFYNVEDKK